MADADAIRRGHRFIDLTGQVFGRLTVVRVASDPGSKTRWLCRCECGTKTVVAASNLAQGQTQSCGCLHRERTSSATKTHGKSGTPEHQSWKAMIQRCCNPSNAAYSGYGGRGITVCERWRTSFEAFLADMGTKPAGHRISVERLNNDGNYEPGNCVWATHKEQANNRRSNRYLTFNGETKLLSEWAKECGLNRTTVRMRIDIFGWSVERALTEPVH